MRAIGRLPDARQQPVRVGVSGLECENVLQGCFCFLEPADVHEAISLVDAVTDIVRLGRRRFFVPAERVLVLAEHRVHEPDEVVNDRLAVVMANGLRERGIGKHELPAGFAQAAA